MRIDRKVEVYPPKPNGSTEHGQTAEIHVHGVVNKFDDTRFRIFDASSGKYLQPDGQFGDAAHLLDAKSVEQNGVGKPHRLFVDSALLSQIKNDSWVSIEFPSIGLKQNLAWPGTGRSKAPKRRRPASPGAGLAVGPGMPTTLPQEVAQHRSAPPPKKTLFNRFAPRFPLAQGASDGQAALPGRPYRTAEGTDGGVRAKAVRGKFGPFAGGTLVGCVVIAAIFAILGQGPQDAAMDTALQSVSHVQDQSEAGGAPETAASDVPADPGADMVTDADIPVVAHTDAQDMAQLREELAKVTEARTQAETSLAVAAASVRDERARAETLADQARQDDARARQLQADVEQLSGEIAQLQADLAAQTTLAEDAEARLVQSDDALSAARAVIAGLEAERDAAAAKLQEADELAHANRQALEAQILRADEAEERLAAALARIELAEAEMQEAVERAQTAQATARLATSRARAAITESGQLTARLSDADERVAQANARVADIEAARALAERQLAEARNELDRSEARVLAARSATRDAEAEAEALASKAVANIEAELADAVAGRQSAVQELEAAVAARTALEAELDAALADRAELEAEVTPLRERTEAAEAALAEVTARADIAEASLSELSVQLEQVSVQSTENRDATLERLAAAETRVSDLTAARDAAVARAAAAEDRLAQVAEQAEQAEVRLASLSAQIETAEHAVTDDLNARLADLAAQRDAAVADLNAVRAERDAALRGNEALKETLETRVAALGESARMAQDRLDAAEEARLAADELRAAAEEKLAAVLAERDVAAAQPARAENRDTPAIQAADTPRVASVVSVGAAMDAQMALCAQGATEMFRFVRSYGGNGLRGATRIGALQSLMCDQQVPCKDAFAQVLGPGGFDANVEHVAAACRF